MTITDNIQSYWQPCGHSDDSFIIPFGSVILVISSDVYGSGHGTSAVLLPGFAINW